MYKLKNDKYRRARGGKAFVISLFCTACESRILDYQKDGDGTLKRCYLNRLLAPANLETLQHDESTKHIKDIPSLLCPGCGEVIGVAIIHHDGRYAFKLRQGHFIKKRLTA